jgi:hypothetical protein
MPGLDPGIHPSSQETLAKKMDHRVKPGDDEFSFRHCEERSDEAIQLSSCCSMNCFACARNDGPSAVIARLVRAIQYSRDVSD